MEVRIDLAHRLRASPVLFFNLILWTQRLFHWPESEGFQKMPLPHDQNDAPFVTWPCQDREIECLDWAVRNGRSIWCVKSREVGWTWIHLMYDLWKWCLFPTFLSLVASRKQEEVDYIGTSNTLFHKLVYNLERERVPHWIVHPKAIDRRELVLANRTTKSVIKGESTNSNIARSGRFHKIMVDEAAYVDNLEAIDYSVGGATGTRVYLSTPEPGTFFTKLAAHPGFLKRRIAWYEHPERGLHRKLVRVGAAAKAWRNPYREKMEREHSPEWLARNEDMDLGGAGKRCFNREAIIRLKEEHARKPDRIGELVWANIIQNGKAVSSTTTPDLLGEGDAILHARQWHNMQWRDKPNGNWSLWVTLERSSVNGRPRPPQDRVYGFGLDPGEGRRVANSAIVGFDLDSKEQVCEWVSADYSAKDAARMLVAIALWFGGRRPAVINWETNGCGGAVTDMVMDRRMLGYPHVYRRRDPNKKEVTQSDKAGWYSSKWTKSNAVELFADAMMIGRTKMRSARFYDDCLTLIVLDGGSVGQEKVADMETSAQESHGDLVISGIVSHMISPGNVAETDDQALMRRAANDPGTQHGRYILAQIAELNENSGWQSRNWRRKHVR